jgi:starvation-inducible DNA-binding protein
MAPPVAQALTTDRKIEKGEKESFRHLKCFVAAVTPRRRHMTVTSESPHLPPLGGHARTEVGRELEATLLELIDLSLFAKQLHWSLGGPLVPVLHRHLDELIESWRELADKAAERAIAIGYWPDGQADAVAARDEHAAVARGPVEDQAVVSLLAQFLAAVNERTRGRLSRLGALDVVSQQVLIEVVRELEQQLWMLRAQLPPGS